MKKSIVILALLSIVSTVAQAEVVGFDSPPIPWGSRMTGSYEENGMLFSGWYAYAGDMDSLWPENGSEGYLSFATGSSLRVESVNGDAFSLNSVDLAEYSRVSLGNQKEIIFQGFRTDGAVVTESFTIDGEMDGINDFETFYFSEDFSNLEFFKVNTTTYSMDNLNFTTAVPVPGAVVLFFSGICGVFGVFFRKKKAGK